MIARFALAGLLAAASLLGVTATGQEKKDDKKPDEKKKDEPRKGTVTGVVTAKMENWIEVKADGEDKARKYYYPPKDEAMTKAVGEAAIDARVSLEWVFGERFRVTKLEVLKKGGKDDKKDEPRKGTVTGVVSAKADDSKWIEVKADGEEKARRYVPHWVGGNPDKGGGPDKDVVAKIKDTPVNARVKLDWEFEERARVVKIEVLKKSDGKDEKKDEPRSGSISGEVKSTKEQNNNVTIEVLAPGEEKARSYFVQWDQKLKAPMPEVLKAVKAAKVGDKVAFDWEATNHGPAIVKFEVLKKTEPKKDEKK